MQFFRKCLRKMNEILICRTRAGFEAGGTVERHCGAKEKVQFPSDKDLEGETGDTFRRDRTDRRTDRQVQVACVSSQVAIFRTASLLMSLQSFGLKQSVVHRLRSCLCTRRALRGGHFVSGNQMSSRRTPSRGLHPGAYLQKCRYCDHSKVQSQRQKGTDDILGKLR